MGWRANKLSTRWIARETRRASEPLEDVGWHGRGSARSPRRLEAADSQDHFRPVSRNRGSD